MIAMTGVPTVKLGEHARLHQPRRARRSTTRSRRAASRAWARPAPPSRSPTARRARGRKLDFDSSELGIGTPGDRPGEADARLGPAGDRGGRASSPVRSSPTSAASTPGCAERSRSPSDQLEATTGRRRPRSPSALSWPDLSEDLPVDVLPCSNDEYFPPPPTREQLGDHATLAEPRDRALAAQVRDEPARSSCAPRRRRRSASGRSTWSAPGAFGNYGWAHNTATTDACDLEWDGRKGLETLRNLPGEFIFDVQSHHVDPDGHVAGHQPGASTPSSRARLAAGRREAAARSTRSQNLSRFHYLKELFLDSATTMTVLSVRADLAGHRATRCRSPRRRETVDTVNDLAALAALRSCTRS